MAEAAIDQIIAPIAIHVLGVMARDNSVPWKNPRKVEKIRFTSFGSDPIKNKWSEAHRDRKDNVSDVKSTRRHRYPSQSASPQNHALFHRTNGMPTRRVPQKI